MTMSSRYIHNPAVDDPSKLQAPANTRQELLDALTTITSSYPPLEAYSSHECHGLYSGPTSIAYLFLHLNQSHSDLKISNHSPLHWCKAYLAGKRSATRVSADRNGVINEQLAFYAVRSATNQDLYDVQSLVQAVQDDVLTDERGSDEWLYGRAGSLYLLRLVSYWVPESSHIVQRVMGDLAQLITSHGPSWPWHGKDYLGAVHGRIGIIAQLVLSDPQMLRPDLSKSLAECLDLQFQDGNWPSSIDSGHHHLVQFCHGAPGFVVSLKAIQQYCPPHLEDQISAACRKAEELIFGKGLLTKEPNLCHGTTSNALSLPSPEREHLMTFTSAKLIARGKQQGWYIEGDDPFGLFCGLAGRAWGWAQLDAAEKSVTIIGYNDV